MLERVGPSLSEAEVAAMRLLTAGRGGEVRDQPLLLALETKGYVLHSPDGWSVTIAGHLAYLKALAESF